MEKDLEEKQGFKEHFVWAGFASDALNGALHPILPEYPQSMWWLVSISRRSFMEVDVSCTAKKQV